MESDCSWSLKAANVVQQSVSGVRACVEVQCRNSVSSDLSIAADGPAYSTGGTQLKLEEFMYEIGLLHRIHLGLELM